MDPFKGDGELEEGLLRSQRLGFSESLSLAPHSMSNYIVRARLSQTDRQTDRPTDRQTDRQTDPYVFVLVEVSWKYLHNCFLNVKGRRRRNRKVDADR